MASKSFVFRFADVEVHEREFRLAKGGEVLAVEPKAFRVLLHLLRNPAKLIPKEELLNAVWGDAAVTDNSLARSIALLRRLLGDDARSPKYIETVSTVGYRFLCPIEVVEDLSGQPIPADQPADEEARENRAAPKTSSRKSGLLWWWMAVSAVCLLAVLAAGIWYLRRPLPPPRVTAYKKLTHDGFQKVLAGTDGARIYFNYSTADPISEVAVTGGEIEHIPVAVRDGPLLEDVSPDGSNFLVTSAVKGFVPNSPQWNLRIPGGPLRSLPDAAWGAYSPDGNTVAFWTAANNFTTEGDLWLVRSDGSGAHILASAQKLGSIHSSCNNIAWSPDGGTIRFFRDDGLWEISSNGSNLHQLSPAWRVSSSRQCCGRWTADGRLFIFLDVSLGPFPRAEIWALEERHGPFSRSRADPFQLTTGPIDWGSFVNYTPSPLIPGKDGKTIFATGTTFRGELSRFDGKSGQFLPFLGGISAEGVSFSKDGRFIAYVTWPEGVLWKANRDGSSRVQLSDPPIHPFLPRWSPDGTTIIFSDLSFSGSPTDSRGIYMVSTEGESPQRLLSEYRGALSDPTWSADGRKIVFSVETEARDDLRILDLATHEVTTVPGSESTFSPRWSPDGRWIAAITDGALGLNIFDTETRQWSQVLKKTPVGFPAWSRDSRFVYFNGDGGVFRIRASGGKPELVADTKDIHFGGSWGWMGLDPTDAPLLVRDVGSDDIYALTLEWK